MSEPIITIFRSDSDSGPSSWSGGEDEDVGGDETVTEERDEDPDDRGDPESRFDPWNPDGIDALDPDESTFASSGPFAASPVPNPQKPEYRDFFPFEQSIRVTRSEVSEPPSGGSRGEQWVVARFDMNVVFEVTRRSDEGDKTELVVFPAIVELMFFGPVIGPDHTVTSPATFERDVYTITQEISDWVYTLSTNGMSQTEAEVRGMVMEAYEERRLPRYQWPERWKEYRTPGPVIFIYWEAP
jgi:hypothetical protein